MSKKEEKSLVPVKRNTLPVPVKKGELKTPFSLVDETTLQQITVKIALWNYYS